MHWGRFGTLIAFCVSTIGGGLVVPPEQAHIGGALIAIGLVTLVVTIWVSIYSNRREIRTWATRVGKAQIILLVGILGTWLFLTLTLGMLAWMVATGAPVLATAIAEKEEGPLVWYGNLIMEGGPPVGRNVFSLTFHGGNVSQKEVQLKSAEIRSANKGTSLPLEIVAMGEAGKNEIVAIDNVQLIPAGAPIKLVAKFNLPDGLAPADFLATWSKFNLVVSDDTREYRIPFHEGHLAAFFPGMVGPHVTQKPKKT